MQARAWCWAHRSLRVCKVVPVVTNNSQLNSLVSSRESRGTASRCCCSSTTDASCNNSSTYRIRKAQPADVIRMAAIGQLCAAFSTPCSEDQLKVGELLSHLLSVCGAAKHSDLCGASLQCLRQCRPSLKRKFPTCLWLWTWRPM
jgi:hypothetical protein